MKRFFSIIVLVLCLFGLTINNAFAQNDNEVIKKEMVTVTMKNGEKFTGEIIYEDAKKLKLSSKNGNVELFIAQIKKIKEYNDPSVFDFKNPNSTHYFISPTAVPLKKGKGYYQNTYGLLNFVNVGITDNISIGGGFDFITPFTGTALWLVAPKASFKVADKIHLGAGGIVVGFGAQDHVSTAYGVATYGDSDFNQ